MWRLCWHPEIGFCMMSGSSTPVRRAVVRVTDLVDLNLHSWLLCKPLGNTVSSNVVSGTQNKLSNIHCAMSS